MEKLNERHRMAIELLVLEGKRQREVAQIIEVAEETVCRWMRMPVFIKEYQDMMRLRMNKAAVIAQQRIEELVFADSENVSLSAAKDILSRTGFDAPSKQEIKAEGIAIKVDYNDKEE